VCVLQRCSSVEEKLNIPEGTLKRIVKTKEQKEKDLEAVSVHSLTLLNIIITWMNELT